MWYVADMFGFAWGDLVETLDEAREQLHALREDPIVKQYDIELEIVRA